MAEPTNDISLLVGQTVQLHDDLVVGKRYAEVLYTEKMLSPGSVSSIVDPGHVDGIKIFALEDSHIGFHYSLPMLNVEATLALQKEFKRGSNFIDEDITVKVAKAVSKDPKLHTPPEELINKICDAGDVAKGDTVVLKKDLIIDVFYGGIKYCESHIFDPGVTAIITETPNFHPNNIGETIIHLDGDNMFDYTIAMVEGVKKSSGTDIKKVT